ncbi:MAG TPA: haloacid dehalogenase-like hydrolase [Polyangiaceae bacterium]
MQVQSAEAVWARIAAEAARDGGAGVVATDGDGTLWSGDVGEDLFFAFVDHGRFEEPALEAMRREARAHTLSDAGSGREVARRIYDAYVEGRFPEERVCELMAWCFAGWTGQDVAAFARRMVESVALEGRLHREVLSVLERARAAGIATVLVSASPVAVVEAAGARVGFPPGSIVAARPCFDGDVVLADVHRPIPYGPGKVSRLRELIGAERTVYGAFGDNAFDVALLSIARVGVAVRPKPRLRERAHEVPGVVELEALRSPA